jgi:hypothetical protein
MKYSFPLLIAILLVSVIRCGPSVKVSADFDRSVNFRQYKTFRLYKAENMSDAVSSLNRERISKAIISEMVKRGYQEQPDTADLLINPVAILKDRVAVSSNTDFYGYGSLYRPYYWGTGAGFTGTTTYNVQEYKDGSLIIDIIAANTRKLVWQGVGNSEIDKPLKDPDTQIPNAVSAIMAKFPPGDRK